jgi:MFS family permease
MRYLVAYLAALRLLLQGRGFRRLFAVRVTSQCTDGVFQVALASYVLFSPERAPDAGSIAAGLAALLLPFSVLGPFVGVFLDRWSRRQVLVFANLLRVVPVAAVALTIRVGGDERLIFGLALAIFSINRFLLADLSASLPHVVETERLVLANAITPTSGTIAFMLGLAIATGLRPVVPGTDPDVAIVVVSAVGYLVASRLAARIPRDQLGPEQPAERPGIARALGNVTRGLVGGLRHLRRRPTAAGALAVIAAHRFFYGVSTVTTVLLYRNYFNDPADTGAGLSGLSVAVLVSGAGFLLAAVCTPIATARMSPQQWMVLLLLAAALVEAFPGALFTPPALLVAAFFLGLSAQGVKICVDTLVQATVDDAFRGRVFALYDVIFNVVFVGAAAVAAVVVPPSGKSYAVLGGISLGYAVTGLGYHRVRQIRRLRSAPALDRIG